MSQRKNKRVEAAGWPGAGEGEDEVVTFWHIPARGLNRGAILLNSSAGAR